MELLRGEKKEDKADDTFQVLTEICGNFDWSNLHNLAVFPVAWSWNL